MSSSAAVHDVRENTIVRILHYNDNLANHAPGMWHVPLSCFDAQQRVLLAAIDHDVKHDGACVYGDVTVAPYDAFLALLRPEYDSDIIPYVSYAEYIDRGIGVVSIVLIGKRAR